MNRDVSNIIVAAIIGVSVIVASLIFAISSRYERVPYLSSSGDHRNYVTLDRWTGRIFDLVDQSLHVK